MKELLSVVPERPLTREEVMKISDQDSVDWGAAPATDEAGNVFTFILVFPEKAYALGFNDDKQQWGVISKVNRKGRRGEAKELDSAIQEWADEHYGEKSDQIAPEFPDLNNLSM